MKNRSKKLVALAVGLGVLTVAFAGPREGPINGLGRMSCAEHLDPRTVGEVNAQWVSGFLSGYNIFGTDKQVPPPDIPTIKLYIDKYCRDNPLRTVADGAFQLVGELGGWSSRK